jgi:hypothetical protein
MHENRRECLLYYSHGRDCNIQNTSVFSVVCAMGSPAFAMAVPRSSSTVVACSKISPYSPMLDSGRQSCDARKRIIVLMHR